MISPALAFPLAQNAGQGGRGAFQGIPASNERMTTEKKLLRLTIFPELLPFFVGFFP